MALFPRIQSPCPYKANLAAVMDGDFCRMCKREVTDLTAMSDGERVAFFGACKGDKVCVTYTLPVLAAAATLAMASAASAADMVTEVVLTGGVHPTKVEFVQHAEAAQAVSAPASELPVVYDRKPAAPREPAKPAEPAKPSK